MNAFTTPDITASMAHVQARQVADNANSLVSGADKAKMMEKANEFESFFVYQMMELMKTTTETEFDGGHGEEVFRHTLTEHMADSVVKAGGFGLSKVVYDQLLKQQEQRAASLAAAQSASGAYTATSQLPIQ